MAYANDRFLFKFDYEHNPMELSFVDDRQKCVLHELYRLNHQHLLYKCKQPPTIGNNMRFKRLDLNQLVVLDALLAERSVTKAAARVYLSQSATSCALARLREYFDDDLVVQVGKTMLLTPKAQGILKPVRNVLLQIEAITTSKPHFDPKTIARKLRIEASDYLINVLLAEVIMQCSVKAPHLKFDLRTIGIGSSERLDNGEIDLLIAPEFVLSTTHPSEPLFRDTFSCVAWLGNTEVGAHISAEQFFSLGHVATQWGGGRLQSVEDTHFAKHNQVRRHEVTVPNYTLIPQFLIGTNRIATLQSRLAHRVALTAPLRVVHCPVGVPVVVEMAQWHRYQEQDPVIRWFRDLICRMAATLPVFDDDANSNKKERSEAATQAAQ